MSFIMIDRSNYRLYSFFFRNIFLLSVKIKLHPRYLSSSHRISPELDPPYTRLWAWIWAAPPELVSMSRPCPLPPCTRNPRSCTPSSVVNETNSREIYRGLFDADWYLPFVSPPLRYRRQTPLSARALPRGGSKDRRVAATNSRTSSQMYTENGGFAKTVPRASGRVECDSAPWPTDCQPKAPSSSHRPTGPLEPRYHRALPRLTSAAALLRRLRAWTNHFSLNFVFLLRHGWAGLNVSLDGCSGGLYLDDGVLRGAYLKNREVRLSPSVTAFLSLPTSFSACCHDLILPSFFSRPLNFVLCLSCSCSLFLFKYS